MYKYILNALLILLFVACNPQYEDDIWVQAPTTKYELPRIEATDFLLEYPAGEFSLVYSTQHKHSKWVAWQLLKRHSGNAGRWDQTDEAKTSGWPQDSRIPAESRVERRDFYGFDRGHQCPSADRQATKAMNKETFFYSNMSPQRGKFNQRIWADLESNARDWARDRYCDTLFICSGGTITRPDLIEKYQGGLAIPKYYFKVFLRKNGLTKLNGGYDAIGFWFENRDYGSTSLRSEAVTIKSIEEKTGINFFYSLPPLIQDVVENQCNPNDWEGL